MNSIRSVAVCLTVAVGLVAGAEPAVQIRNVACRGLWKEANLPSFRRQQQEYLSYAAEMRASSFTCNTFKAASGWAKELGGIERLPVRRIEGRVKKDDT